MGSNNCNSTQCKFCQIRDLKTDLLYEDDLIFIFKDKFPKARVHFLICPKEHIKNVDELTSNHQDLLDHMENKVHKVLTEDIYVKEYFLGFHVPPFYSVKHLHMHCVSEKNLMNKIFMRSLDDQRIKIKSKK